MLYEIENQDGELVVTKKYLEKPASELGIQEKTIEDWIAKHPQLLFPREEVLVFGQSVAGQAMADILALDALGNLVLVEIKRDWSDRSTIAQLLEYAANYKDAAYDTFNQIAQKYNGWIGGELIDKFRQFIERPEFPLERIGQEQRVFIVAPDSDAGLKRIVNWLQGYGVPIEFIPFRLLADEDDTLRMIDITGVSTDVEIEPPTDSWAGHWIFNTNETHAPGAYERMFEVGVIAIYGYENGGANLEGSAPGEKVFAYVNKQGLRALGEIRDPTVRPGKGIFLDEQGRQQPEEYHVLVDWQVVLSPEAALSNSGASDMGYPLPVRTVFGHLHRGRLAGKLEEEIKRRAGSQEEC
jgi:hypothetical protein